MVQSRFEKLVVRLGRTWGRLKLAGALARSGMNGQPLQEGCQNGLEEGENLASTRRLYDLGVGADNRRQGKLRLARAAMKSINGEDGYSDGCFWTSHSR